MARKSIYIRTEDEPWFDELASSGSLSSLIVEALRAYTGRDIPSDMEEIVLWVGLKKIRFIGKQIWPPSEDSVLDPSVEHHLEYFESNLTLEAPYFTRVRIFNTKKGKFLKHWFDDTICSEYYSVYDSLGDLANKHGLVPEHPVYQWLALRAGNPVVEDLDL